MALTERGEFVNVPVTARGEEAGTSLTARGLHVFGAAVQLHYVSRPIPRSQRAQRISLAAYGASRTSGRATLHVRVRLRPLRAVIRLGRRVSTAALHVDTHLAKFRREPLHTDGTATYGVTGGPEWRRAIMDDELMVIGLLGMLAGAGRKQ